MSRPVKKQSLAEKLREPIVVTISNHQQRIVDVSFFGGESRNKFEQTLKLLPPSQNYASYYSSEVKKG